MMPSLRRAGERLLTRSLRAAAEEQGLASVARRLAEIAGTELSEQYTDARLDSDYLRTKVLCQHAFQVDLCSFALAAGPAVVADIGDSSGLHSRYLKALHPGAATRFVSVNLDPTAVEKVRAKGQEAHLGRAEDVGPQIRADVVLLLETLEHLPNPFDFLHKLTSRFLVLTVPYVRKSRLGLHHIRAGLKRPITAERVHLLELCPEDLRLLFAHTGWKVERERVYRQYPLRSPLRVTAPLWRRWDFEGFYGAVLSRDETWSSLYQSWG
jgi:hypothetical protein